MEADERIWRYAEEFFQRSGRTEFPTVGRVARALKIKTAAIMEIADGHELIFLSGYNVEELIPSELLVETFEDERGVFSPPA